MIEIILTMFDNSVQTRIKGKMSVSEVIIVTNAFCSAMISLLQHGGMSEEDAQRTIAAASMFASEISDDNEED